MIWCGAGQGRRPERWELSVGFLCLHHPRWRPMMGKGTCNGGEVVRRATCHDPMAAAAVHVGLLRAETEADGALIDGMKVVHHHVRRREISKTIRRCDPRSSFLTLSHHSMPIREEASHRCSLTAGFVEWTHEWGWVYHACWRSCLHLVRLPALCSAGLRPHSIPKQFTRVVGAMGVHVRAAAAAAAAQHITRTLTHILPIIIRFRTAPPPWAACIACQRRSVKRGDRRVCGQCTIVLCTQDNLAPHHPYEGVPGTIYS